MKNSLPELFITMMRAKTESELDDAWRIFERKFDKIFLILLCFAGLGMFISGFFFLNHLPDILVRFGFGLTAIIISVWAIKRR